MGILLWIVLWVEQCWFVIGVLRYEIYCVELGVSYCYVVVGVQLIGVFFVIIVFLFVVGIMMLFDIGVNFIYEFFVYDLDVVLVCVQLYSVVWMVVIGVSCDGSCDVLVLVQVYFGVLYVIVGVYLYYVVDYDEVIDVLLCELVMYLQVCVVGEIGLDYYCNYLLYDVQCEVFECQLCIVVELGKLLFLYQCDVYGDFIVLLCCYCDKVLVVVVYCFIDIVEVLCDYFVLDCYIGIIGWICDECCGIYLCELVKVILVNWLMIEIDVFYLLLCIVCLLFVYCCNELMYFRYIVEEIVCDCGELFELLVVYIMVIVEVFFGFVVIIG